ncbi:amidohydrolase [Paenibacillus eucommiae]|uniref:Amidohydrolase YtcJ n=1 Tax=Paenibacillus eucommiae TaxID=1355755 RepID=A0ABS4J6F3_9BACL|nr:amidohydrolase [Paenibacillus eucommiae]MBP1995402.1 putative amidohydrolase YtcJ [Paenibacillus eucommiae]
MFADTLLYNGQIVSMDPNQSQFSSILIKNGRIVGLGDQAESSPFIHPETKLIDLEGRTVLPGFIDAHQHMTYFGANLLNLECNHLSIADMVKAVEQRAAALDADEWIIGWGLNEALLEEKRLPEASDFAHIPNPVYIVRFCAHTAVINDKALAMAGVDNQTVEPRGGEIVRDSNGKATGVLKEKAMELVQQVIPSYSLEQIKQAILLADAYYIRQGITSVHEAGVGLYTNSLQEFRAFQELLLERRLNTRVYCMVLDTFFPELQAMQLTTGFGSERFKIGAVKMFADGTLTGGTAAIIGEYAEPLQGQGMLMHSDEEMEQKVLEAHKQGCQISIHAIGDRAIEQVISAYEKALSQHPRADSRHRIEHCKLSHPGITERMQRSGIIPVPQPAIYHQAGDVYNQILKPDILKDYCPLRSWLDAGLKPPGSSDCPIVSCSPLLGIYAAITRKTRSGETIVPEQSISLYEALQMYTSHGAYASFSEDELGTLELGKMADLVVLPKGFMDFSAEEIKNTEIEMTIINGKVCYEKKQGGPSDGNWSELGN